MAHNLASFILGGIYSVTLNTPTAILKTTGTCIVCQFFFQIQPVYCSFIIISITSLCISSFAIYNKHLWNFWHAIKDQISLGNLLWHLW